MKRKLLSAALALVMCLCLLPGAALAAEGDELDLSNASADVTGSGYSWTASSKTLTLADGFRAAKVTLPDDAVTIVTNGIGIIDNLAFNNSSTTNTELTFSGEGTLTVSQQINIASGDYNTLTVNDKANVIANGGIFIGTGGGTNSIVTINGKLEVYGANGIAIHAGSVAVGTTGILNVYGKEGVLLEGMPRITGAEYVNLFTVKGNGRFTANCSDYNIRVNSTTAFSDGMAEAAIPLGPEYLPADCEVRRNEETQKWIDLFKKGTNDIYKGDITIHQKHEWNRDSWEKDDTGHWYACIFSGCDKQDSYAVHELDWQKDGSNHWQKCTVCGYETAQEAHSLSPQYSYSDDSHWQECTVCGHKTTHEAHDLIERNDDTNRWQECTKCQYTTKPQSHRLIEKYDEDKHWQKCTECGYETEAEPHSFSLQYDGAEHWQECGECGCKIEVAPHVYDNDNDASCNICGYTRTIGGPIDGGFMGDYFSDWSSVGAYAVTVAGSEHGKVSADCARASGGSAVTLTAVPDGGYELDVLTVADSRGNAVRVIARSGGKYAFTMPDRDVTVSAVFAPLPEEPDDAQKPCDGGADCPSRGFTDLGSVEAWYHAAVDYVLQSGLMSGYGEGLFGPDDNLSRAQFAQILYNREGKPAATGLGAFTDVAPEAWYAPAIAWAAERGIVSGGGMFGPDDSITREQLAVMLWRYAGSPAAAGGELRFTDAGKASGYALEALRWAVEAGVMRGDGGFLNPGGLATRAQAAEILMNYFK